MATWIVFLIIALLFFIAEIYTPTMFFLNFSIASVCCALFSLIIDSYNILIPLFAVLSILSILFLRPFLNINPNKEKSQYFESQYIGAEGKTITEVSAHSGRITVYDENWEARLNDENAKPIAKGKKVSIIRHTDLIMYVEVKGKK
jgi:membrane protein implicated in regulation of membrane protease activity